MTSSSPGCSSPGASSSPAIAAHAPSVSGVDFNPSPEVESLLERIRGVHGRARLPGRGRGDQGDRRGGRAGRRPTREILVEIRATAKEQGLWNLFLPDGEYGAGLSNWEYGILCEQMGRSPVVAPMAFNCSAPDTGNMEILVDHGTDEQKERFLQPLLDGEIRSCFSMTEPEVSGSDPTTLQTRAELTDGDEWVINGHKWFTSGAIGADFAIAMVVTDPDAPPYTRASMILVPIDTPGFDLVRTVSVMGHDKGPGHCEIRYKDCRVPESNLLGERGAGFVIAQDRLGPGPHPPLHARDRNRRARDRDDVRASQLARKLRRAARRQAVRPGLHRQVADGGRPGPAADPLRRLADGHRGQAPRPPGDLDDQGRRRQHRHGRARPRDPGPRLARDVRRHPARRHVALHRACCGSPTGRTRSTRW